MPNLKPNLKIWYVDMNVVPGPSRMSIGGTCPTWQNCWPSLYRFICVLQFFKVYPTNLLQYLVYSLYKTVPFYLLNKSVCCFYNLVCCVFSLYEVSRNLLWDMSLPIFYLKVSSLQKINPYWLHHQWRTFVS